MNCSPEAASNRISGGEVRIRKTREGKPKSRNGCMTCKVRRVKCDETKPVCQRCTRFGQRCDGYIAKSTSKNQLCVKTTRVIAPKGHSQSPTPENALLNPSPRSPFTPISQLPIRTPFQTPSEQEAFHNFCERTAHQLSSSSSNGLWTRLILQACESSPAIQYAVVAIGAINLSESSCHSSEPQVGTLKHQFAFRQCRKSTCLLRREFAGELSDFRTTLTACLLFYCFETVRPYHELAIDRVFSGLRLIRSWASSFCAADENRRRKEEIKREDPDMIENEILRTLSNLEVQVLSYAQEKEREAHEHFKKRGQAIINDMPKSFGGLHEAREALELVVRRSMHWLRSTMHVQQFSTTDTQTRTPLCFFFDTNPRFDDKMLTLQEYHRWDEAFKPLLNYARSKASSEETFLRASMLRLHWLSGYLSICSNNSRSSLVNNGKFTIELQELVHIARTLLNSSGKAHTSDSGDAAHLGPESVFDMQIIVPLMTVGWIYRHRTLRREAIELLLRIPRKEGVLDGIVVGKAMVWLADIEEEGLDSEDQDEEYVPEAVAVRCISITFEIEKKLAIVNCVQSVRGGSVGKEVQRETVIPW